jgi:DNA-binding MarR family transcriptional regulator
MKENEKEFVPTPCMMIRFTSKLFGKKVKQMAEENGIPFAYKDLVFQLAANSRSDDNGLTQCDLSNLTHLSAPTVSVTLQNMERDGYIIRAQDSGDARQIRVRLTDKGFELEKKVRQLFSEAEEKATEGLTEEELSALKDVLTKIINNLKDN